MLKLPDRLPDETEKAYSAFVHYCGLGYNRSLADLGNLLGKSASWAESWSSRYNWQERVKVYDDQIHLLVATEQAKAHLSEIEKLRKRSSELADKLLKAAEVILERIIAESSEIYINAQSLNVVSSTMAKALDIHSHGLGIDALLPQLKAELDEATDD